jgi:hypothetical protein
MAFAESLVLASAAGVIISLSASCSLAGRFIGGRFPGVAIISVGLPSAFDWIALISGVCVWVVFYTLALSAHRDVRDVFWALTDLSVKDFLDWIDQVSLPITERQKKKARSISNFLIFLTPPD